MFDSVKEGYKTIFQEDRAIVIGWLKDHPEIRKYPLYSVYLGQEAKYLPVEDYLKSYGQRRPASLHDAIADLPCVQEGWKDGVPGGEREEWLDDVVKAVRSYLQFE